MEIFISRKLFEEVDEGLVSGVGVLCLRSAMDKAMLFMGTIHGHLEMQRFLTGGWASDALCPLSIY